MAKPVWASQAVLVVVLVMLEALELELEELSVLSVFLQATNAAAESVRAEARTRIFPFMICFFKMAGV